MFFLSRICFRAFIACFLWRARAAPAKRECVLMDSWELIGIFLCQEKGGHVAMFFCHALVSARLSLAFCGVRAASGWKGELSVIKHSRQEETRTLTREGSRGGTRGGTRPARAGERPIQLIKSNTRKRVTGRERPIQFIKSNTCKGLRGMRGGTRPARAGERPDTTHKDKNAQRSTGRERPIQRIKSNTRKGLRGANARYNS